LIVTVLTFAALRTAEGNDSRDAEAGHFIFSSIPTF